MTAETVSLRITLRYKDFEEFSDRFAENISSAGLFLRTRSPKPTGTKIRFELLLANGDRILRGEGAVVSVRHDDRPGMALRFAALDQQSQDVVDRVVAQHGEGELAPTPLATPFRRGSSVGGPGLSKGFGGGFGFGGAGAGFGSGGGVLPRSGSSWAGRSSEPPRSPSQPAPVAPSRRGSTARPWEALARDDSQATQRIDSSGLEEPATQRISVSPGPSQDIVLHEEKTELAASPLPAPELATEALAAAPLPAPSEPSPSELNLEEARVLASSTAMTVEFRASSPPSAATEPEDAPPPIDATTVEAPRSPEAFEGHEAPSVPLSGLDADAVPPVTQVEAAAVELPVSGAAPADTPAAALDQPEAMAFGAPPTAEPRASDPALMVPESLRGERDLAATAAPAVDAAFSEPEAVTAVGTHDQRPAVELEPVSPPPVQAASAAASAELETVEVERPVSTPVSVPTESEASPSEALIAWDAQIPSEITSAKPAAPELPDAPDTSEPPPDTPAEAASSPVEASPAAAVAEAPRELVAPPAEAAPPTSALEDAPAELGPDAELEPRPTWAGAPAPRPSWVSDLRVSDPPPASPATSVPPEEGALEARTADLVRPELASESESGSEEPLLVVPVDTGSFPPVAPTPPTVSEALSSAVPFEVPPESPSEAPGWVLDVSPRVPEAEELERVGDDVDAPSAPVESVGDVGLIDGAPPEPGPLESEPEEALLEAPPFEAPLSPAASIPPAWSSETPNLAVPALRTPDGNLPTPLPREASTPRQSFPALESAARAAQELPPPPDFSERSDQAAPSAPPPARAASSASTRPALELRGLEPQEAVEPSVPSAPPVEQDIEDFLGSFAPGELSSPERSNPSPARPEGDSGASPGSWASEIQSDNLRASEPNPASVEPPRAPPPRRGSGLVRSESVRAAAPSPTPPPSASPPVDRDAHQLIEAFAAEKSSPEKAIPHEEATEVLQLDRVAEARSRRGEREVSVRGVGPPDGGRTPSQLDLPPVPPRVPNATSSVGRRPAVEREPPRVTRDVSIPAGPEPAPPDAAPVVPRRTSVPPVAGQWTDEAQRPELRGKPIVGLELGGRWARLGMMTNGRFEPLKLGGDERYFAMIALRDDGSVAVGPEALALAAQAPDRVFSPRRLLGLVNAGGAAEDAPVITAGPEGVRVQLLGKSYDLAQVISNLLEPLRSRIEAAVGANAARVIMTIPFEADERVKNVLRQACKKANLELVRLVTEPAAILHAADFERKPVDSLLTVDLDAYDLTVSVARRGRSGFGVSLGAFEPALSAARLNEAVVRYLIGELERQGEDLRADPLVRARLEGAVDAALEQGPKDQSLEVKVSFPGPGAEVERHIAIPMQRVIEVTERWVQEIMTKVNEVLADAGIHPRALGAIMLAGSTSRHPALVRELMAQTQIRPQDELSGSGLRVRGLAAMAQRMLAEERVDRPERLSRPVGLGLPGGRYRALVTTSDPLPSRQKRKQATTRDFQSELELMFYQGSAEQVSGNTFLGSVSLTGLPKAARGEVQVEVEIELDPDAVLIVTLSEAESGRRARLTVPTADTPHPRVQALREQPSVVDLSDPGKAKPDKKGLIGRFFGR